MGEPIPEVDWIVEGLLPAGGTALIVGPPKSGKSTLGRNIVAAIGEGRDILGTILQTGAGALLLIRGAARAGVAAHFREMGIDPKAPISVYHGEAFAPRRSTVEIVEAEIEKTGATVIVIDTLLEVPENLRRKRLRRSFSNATQAIIDLAARTGATVIGVHHSRGRAAGEHGEEASADRAALFGSGGRR